MGKSKTRKSDICNVCHRSFGITRWRHTCELCKHNVCDDCAPMQSKTDYTESKVNCENTDNVNNNRKANLNINNDSVSNICANNSIDNSVEEHKNANCRICKNCKVYLSNPEDGTNNINNVSTQHISSGHKSQSSQSASSLRPNPNDPLEREKRAQVTEARLRAQQTRGMITSNNQITKERPTQHIRMNEDNNVRDNRKDANNNNNNSSSCKSNNSKDESRKVGGAIPPAGSNPVLEAALRRQKQNALPCNNNAVAQYTVEKVKLLNEIDTLLAKHADTAPFGLRSSDESKLRIYLNYLKEKYNNNVESAV